MKRLVSLILIFAFACALFMFSGCSTDDAEIRKENLNQKGLMWMALIALIGTIFNGLMTILSGS